MLKAVCLGGGWCSHNSRIRHCSDVGLLAGWAFQDETYIGCWSILVEYLLLCSFLRRPLLADTPSIASQILYLTFPIVFVKMENYPTRAKKLRTVKYLLIELQRWREFRNTWWDEGYMRIEIISMGHGCPSRRVASILLLVLPWVLRDLCDHGQTAKHRKWNKVTWWRMRIPWPVFKADISIKMKLEGLWFIRWPL